MDDLEKLFSELAENSDIRVLSPVAIERLKTKGIHLAESPKRTLEESINLLFGDESKRKALDVAKKLPEPPNMAAPSITSLYNEIREAIIFGLNGAAITSAAFL